MEIVSPSEQPSGDEQKRGLAALSEKLGFRETKDLAQLRNAYVAARMRGDAQVAAAIMYEYHV